MAGAVVAAGEMGPGLAAAPPAGPPSWVDRPLRWAQLTLAEDDPGWFDLRFWLDHFRRTRSDAACLSAGGCVGYYPTDIPGRDQGPRHATGPEERSTREVVLHAR